MMRKIQKYITFEIYSNRKKLFEIVINCNSQNANIFYLIFGQIKAALVSIIAIYKHVILAYLILNWHFDPIMSHMTESHYNTNSQYT